MYLFYSSSFYKPLKVELYFFIFFCLQGVFIEILRKILETFKQKISTDVLETCLMSILTDMMTYQKW